MTRLSRRFLAVVAAFALPALAGTLTLPALADARDRGGDTVRRVYTFLGSRLSIRIDAEVPGTVRLIRGETGRIEVTGRAPRGIPGFGLSDRVVDELRMTVVGGERVDYIVVVPEAVRVEVRLPDRHVAEVLGAHQDAATYRWAPRRN